MKLKINNKNYNVKFGYGALKILCKKWNVKTIGGLDPFFKKLDFSKSGEPEIEQWDLIGDLALAGVEYGNKDVNFTADDMLDVLFQNPAQLNDLIVAFSESLPKQNDVNPDKRGN